DPREERVAVDRRARMRLDRRDDDLAHPLVGKPEDDRARDRGVLEEHALDLGRVDRVAARDDDVLRAAREEEPARLLAFADEVAGAEPAVVERRGGGVGRVPVSRRHVRAPELELPDVAARYGRAVGADDPVLDAGDDEAEVAV